MYLSLSSCSCVCVDKLVPWRLFSTENMIGNYRQLSICLEKFYNHKVHLSYHPGMIFDSNYVVKMVRRGLPVNSIDLPDVVKFFDQRMINEARKRQSFKCFVGRMIDHIGWRLLNWPCEKWRQENLIWLIKNLPAGQTVKISSADLKSISFNFPEKDKVMIAIELNAFAHYHMNDYLADISCFIVKNDLDKNKVGLSIDPAHIYQGFVMNKWGEPIEFIEEVIKQGWKIFCLDINPIEVLIWDKIISDQNMKTEEEVEKIVKTHAGFESKEIDFVEIIKLIRNSQINTKDMEICLEIHPQEADKIIRGGVIPDQMEKFLERLNKGG